MAVPNFTDLLEALPLAAFVCDSRLRLSHSNGVAKLLFGSLPDGVLLSLKFRAPDVREAVSATLEDGKPRHVEYHERVPIERWFRVDISLLSAVDSSASCLLLFRDTSESRNIDRMRADFVANASHELRTPLASLSGFIETLKGPAKDDPKARDRFLTIMQEQANRMSRLIDDLLSLSRLEMRPYTEMTSQVDLAAVAREVIDALGPSATNNGVQISLDSTSGTYVSGIRDELVQVFENLIENAIKYGKNGGRVEVAVKPGKFDGDVVISVTDFGAGIEPADVPRLTERFYRASSGNQPVAKGTGLGLAIVKHILSRHQAQLSIQSAPGKGATFSAIFRQTRQIVV
jgi:two-component system, OmpR family, phosphate regulon sensor histidine kinase PhoR